MWSFPIPRRLPTLLQPKHTAILEACLIGLVSGLAAVLLQNGIGWLGGWRIHWAARLGQDWSVGLVLSGLGILGGMIAGWLVERIAPEAIGSGVPQVKAALAKYPITLNLRVASVKLISGIVALGAGLSLGRQGPTVQLGAALAAQLSYWFPTAPDHRQQMIAAGAGAGLAAGFNAPIAGVLFIVEELLQDLSGLTLGTAILSSFVGAVIARIFGGQGLYLNLDQVTASATSFSLPEIPFYIALGVLAGVLGALFNQGVLASVSLSQRVPRVGLPWRMGLAGGICGLIIGLLPSIFQDNTGLRLLLGTGTVGWQLAALALVVKFGLTLVAYGSGAPGGLFAPSLVMGAALGNLVGLVQYEVLGPTLAGLPITYALVGMGAFFGAVSRVPVTGIVIIFEMTTDFNLVLPLMISSVAANLAAEQLSRRSVYDLLLQRQGIDLHAATVSNQTRLDTLTAADIMQHQVETLPSDLSLEQTVKVFAQSHHRGFPIVEEGRLVGIVTRTDLTSKAKRHAPGTVRDIMTPQPVTVRPTATLTDVLYWLNRYKISRLPVTEGRKLVGIITRADIIRVESEQLTGEHPQQGPVLEPAYVVYQTRGPAMGQGRLLLPLANPETADTLLRLAVAIARDRNYEVECVHIMPLPPDRPLAETPVRTAKARRLLQRAVRYGQRHQVAVHTQISVAHDVGQAILTLEKQRHIDLILMGWQGNIVTPGRLLGDTLGTVMAEAMGTVILAKLSPLALAGHLDRWLVPISGGPNVPQALPLLPGLMALSRRAEVRLCQVFTPEAELDTSLVDHYVTQLQPQLQAVVQGTQICGRSVSDTIVDLARLEQFDVIVVGASRESALKQVVLGNIPATIAQTSDRTVLVVRAQAAPAVS